ncbi:hypothetical protein EVAR_61824_1 [Eumeta japonica]|uniref:Uncharacterized protein n=1 Tax=Eumeta variegata TaxID=151549 RepID=A0A4C1YXL8_EUMVA|nr:hypothetical protein EVAR_61824_1 [Eumeta japonica]
MDINAAADARARGRRSPQGERRAHLSSGNGGGGASAGRACACAGRTCPARVTFNTRQPNILYGERERAPGAFII